MVETGRSCSMGVIKRRKLKAGRSRGAPAAAKVPGAKKSPIKVASARVLTTHEAAECLNVTPARVRELVRSGRIRVESTDPGRQHRLNADDVDQCKRDKAAWVMAHMAQDAQKEGRGRGRPVKQVELPETGTGRSRAEVKKTGKAMAGAVGLSEGRPVRTPLRGRIATGPDKGQAKKKGARAQAHSDRQRRRPGTTSTRSVRSQIDSRAKGKKRQGPYTERALTPTEKRRARERARKKANGSMSRSRRGSRSCRRS